MILGAGWGDFLQPERECSPSRLSSCSSGSCASSRPVTALVVVRALDGSVSGGLRRLNTHGPRTHDALPFQGCDPRPTEGTTSWRPDGLTSTPFSSLDTDFVERDK